MNKRSKPSIDTKFGPSKTIPGQALKPAQLLQRHLAGTLPPIDLSARYEHHYDAEGKQIGEPLPLEIHEIHKLSVAIREKQYEESLQKRKEAAEKHKQQIIDAYLAEHPEIKEKKPDQAEKPKGDTPAQKSPL